MGNELTICGVKVIPRVERAAGYEKKPLLYRWTVLDGEQEVMVYVGKAQNGLDRPSKTYTQVVRDLNVNRGQRTIGQEPLRHYFARNKWGYRWVHHELERYAHLISSGSSSLRIELEIIEANIPKERLNFRERAAINAAKLRYAGTSVVANDRPCMNKNRENLDPVWVCDTGSA